MFIANTFGGEKSIKDCMLQNILKEPLKPWNQMTEDEQAEAIAKSKAAHGFKES